MKRLFESTAELDTRASEKFGLGDEILMENAAASIANFIRKKFKKKAKILGVCGAGNNGADVFAALRMLALDYEASFYACEKELKPLAAKQRQRALEAGVREAGEIGEAACIIDGIFGSGLSRQLGASHIKTIEILNENKAYKVACDVPSGLNKQGAILGACVKADVTICMGARKIGLYSDVAKDYTGKILLARLGVSSKNFSVQSEDHLLTRRDMKLPFRGKNDTNKGDFGHVFVLAGEHKGAAMMAANAANAIGAGLVSVVSQSEISSLEENIMQAKSLSAKMNAGALGMGLGRQNCADLPLGELAGKALVIDADMCYEPRVIELLRSNENIVITPHPKEFCSLLALAGIAHIDIKTLQNDRFKFAREWSLKFKNVLLLKGANTIIAQNGRLYIMRHGTSALAKGGSGDVLSGLVAGLLAQGYSPLDAAVTASLAHALGARKFKKNNYALSPKNIIEGVKCLRKK
ncbi:NAD(P)H-hydrate dehydratase [Campylobacter curvus]|uniref:NAD(P)H-hydrate dehydratase n=1 Tax=Campylobacter curvus TaxID=200 RepID=UPI00146FDDFB|nr:NAD(P)H-hydrate dehydratase [Campylobacter curvus]